MSITTKVASSQLCMDGYLADNAASLKYESGLVAVDLAAVRRNYSNIQKHIYPTTIAPVLKSNAYGLGAERVLRSLQAEGAQEFFVATLNEGVKLKATSPSAVVHVLYGPCFGSEELLFRNEIVPVLNTYDQVVRWDALAREKQQVLDCVLHVDTGMSRTGLCRDDADRLLQDKAQFRNINVTYVMSHLCCGEDRSAQINDDQRDAFERFAKHFPEAKKSLSATPAIYSQPDFRLDMARIGYGIYGSYGGNGELPLAQTMHVYSRIVQIRTTHPGETVGYGATYISKEKGKLATLSMGYADGYHRFLHNYQPYVYIGKYKAKVVGRISMDFCVVDVSHIPESHLFEGAWVQMLGKDIRVADLIQGTDFVPHEVPISLGKRYHWVYFE